MDTPGRPLEQGEAQSLAENVYQSLRTSILHGTYRPNQRLVETVIAEELGASRTPVREALQRLGNEGLITKSRHGWLVREFTVDEIREIYEVRTALEGYAARLAAQRATDEDIRRLADFISEQHALMADASATRSAVVELNERFHNAVIAAAGNQRLYRFINANRMYYFNYRLASLYTDEQVIKSLEEHEQLYQAIRNREPDKADELARAHINVALELIEKHLA
ncbi:MAG TPA: GntR family transcriptional regulator [Micromonospora sp.]